MLLTAEEYSKGFIDFDAELPADCAVNIWTDTADDPNEKKADWTGPYCIPSGCKVASASKPYIRLKIELNRGNDPSKTPVLKRVRWERDGKTFLWPGAQGFTGPPGALVLGRDYGTSYRLVFRPKKALWDEEIVLIEKTLRIRFSKEKVGGYEVSGFEEKTSNPNGTTSIEGAVREVKAEGELVEILATITTDNADYGKEMAKTQVESITGLLSLCFGEQILGEKVFEDYFFSSASTEEGEVRIPVKQLSTQSVNLGSALVADTSLKKLRISTLGVAISLALRWYSKGLMYESPVDQFIAFFIGLDALASGHFAIINPTPVRREYTKLQQYLAKAQPQIDNTLKDMVLSRLADFPLTLKFDCYWKSHFQRETQLGGKFSKLNRLRGELLHGKAQSLTPHDVNDAKTMLEKLLGLELGIDRLITARQGGPKLFEASIKYLLKPGVH